MKFRVYTAVFNIDPVDLTQGEVDQLQSFLGSEATIDEWEAEDEYELVSKIEEQYGYTLNTIVFTRV